MTKDPQIILAKSPMRPLQIAAVALCVLLNALDGFDVLAISFASQGIASEWGIDRAALGLVLSMELIGMAIGSMLLGNIADRILYGQVIDFLDLRLWPVFNVADSAISVGAACLMAGSWKKTR